MQTPLGPHSMPPVVHVVRVSHILPVNPAGHSQVNWLKGRSTQRAAFWQGLDEQPFGFRSEVSHCWEWTLKTVCLGHDMMSNAPSRWHTMNLLALSGNGSLLSGSMPWQKFSLKTVSSGTLCVNGRTVGNGCTVCSLLTGTFVVGMSLTAMFGTIGMLLILVSIISLLVSTGILILVSIISLLVSTGMLILVSIISLFVSTGMLILVSNIPLFVSTGKIGVLSLLTAMFGTFDAVSGTNFCEYGE